MSASVVSDGGDAFTLTLSDTTENWTQSTKANSPGAALGSAEVIAEAPSNGQQVLPLGNFGTVDFTGSHPQTSGGVNANFAIAQENVKVNQENAQAFAKLGTPSVSPG